jgi:hypothetical protein
VQVHTKDLAEVLELHALDQLVRALEVDVEEGLRVKELLNQALGRVRVRVRVIGLVPWRWQGHGPSHRIRDDA